MSRSVLFVCTGNTCRSPLAEAMARHLAAERGLAVRMSSAGTSALGGSPASDGSVLVGLERRLDLSTHRARLLTAGLVDEATIILCMAPSHVAVAEALGGGGKTHLLTAFADESASGKSVHDPFGSGLNSYRQMAAELDVALPKVIARLAGDSRGMTSGAP
ncbi:MAG: low molecular weight protein arginine phosphatase [Gemmatimonadetes bacterium]|nr:low molecular weight protein arginine phosphatase [Gemmatimonadota bacterium]